MSRRAERAAVAVAACVFVLAWGLLHVGFWRHDQVVDTPVYAKYGEAITRGDIPYRDFTPEYPPLALPVFALPAFFSHDEDGYRNVFEALMAACGAALLACVAVCARRLGIGPLRPLAVVAVFPLLLGTVVLTRFDLWPALLATAALAALLGDRNRLGAALLGVATAAKLYPAVLLPLAIAWVWRRRGRRDALIALGVFLAVVAAAYGPFVAIAPHGVAHSLGRQLARPLQIETLAAGVLLAAHQAFGLHIAWASSAGSQNLVGRLPDALATVQWAVQVIALLTLWTLFARGPAEPRRLARFSAAAVVAFVALGKVLSPQFLIWLVPLVALTGTAEIALLAAALVTTQVWFPFRYWDLVKQFDPLASWLVLVRDLLLVTLLLTLVRPYAHIPKRWHARRSPRGSRTATHASH